MPLAVAGNPGRNPEEEDDVVVVVVVVVMAAADGAELLTCAAGMFSLTVEVEGGGLGRRGGGPLIVFLVARNGKSEKFNQSTDCDACRQLGSLFVLSFSFHTSCCAYQLLLLLSFFFSFDVHALPPPLLGLSSGFLSTSIFSSPVFSPPCCACCEPCCC